jgi:hypothetical protein
MLKHRVIKLTVVALMFAILFALFVPITARSFAASPLDYMYSYFWKDTATQDDALNKIFIRGTSSGLPRHNVTWLNPQDNITPCRTTPGECVTLYDYAPNGVIRGSSWEFYISGQGRAPGNYSAVISICTYAVGNTCTSWSEVDRKTFTITESVYLVFLPLVGS